MNDTQNTDIMKERPPVGDLTDFVLDVSEENPLHIEIAVDDQYRILVFHNKPFKSEVSWFEFDLNTSKLDFIMDGGDIRGIGMPLKPEIAKYMQNAHQILRVQMDNDTGEPVDDSYVPLILHR